MLDLGRTQQIDKAPKLNVVVVTMYDEKLPCQLLKFGKTLELCKSIESKVRCAKISL